MSGPGTNPAKTEQFSFLDGSETKLNHFSSPNHDPLLTLVNGGSVIFALVTTVIEQRFGHCYA